VKALDPWIDLAILSIDAKELTPISFGGTESLKKGQFVICLGNPYAIARDGNASATWGIISNLNRKAPPRSTTEQAAGSKQESLHQYGTLIQTDAKLLQGTSGGALLNLQGEMIGLTTSIAALDGYDRAAGYAIPMSEAILRVIDQLKQGRQPEYGFLGVAPTNLALAEIQNNQLGAKLNGVEVGTPASRFGLRRDDVITHIDSVPVRSHLDLIRLISLSPVGTDVEIHVQRQNVLLRRTDELTKSVVLTKRFVAAHEQALWTEPTPSWRGASVDYSTAIPYFFQRSAEMDPEGCLVLTQVQQDSPAWQAGLRPGVFITHANGERIFTPSDFWKAVRGVDGEVTVRVTVPIQEETDITVPAL
jgi:serine protease Do